MTVEQSLLNADGIFDLLPTHDPTAPASNLGCLLYAYCEGIFVDQVCSFVQSHAEEFLPDARPRDGSHPIRWMLLHEEFRQLFDDQLEAVLSREGISRDELIGHAAELRIASESLEDGDVLPCSGGLRVRGFHQFLASLTASESYDTFLEVMLAAIVTPAHIIGNSARSPHVAVSLVEVPWKQTAVAGYPLVHANS